MSWENHFVPAEKAYAAWNVIASDATQRDMMLAVAEVALKGNPRMLERVRWIKLKADSLGRIRNDAAHLVVDMEYSPRREDGRLVPNQYGMPTKRYKRLQEAKTLESRFKYVAGDIIALQTYALAVLYQLADPQLRTLPKRPKLRSVPDQR